MPWPTGLTVGPLRLAAPALRRAAVATALVACFAASAACDGDWGEGWGQSKKQPASAPALTPEEQRQRDELQRIARAREDLLRGTIGELAYIPPRPGLFVESYGVVAGLGTNGSAEVPERIREELVKRMRKDVRLRDEQGQSVIGDPEKFLRSLDNAVVLVSGVIPYGALAGDRFDLDVQALPQTQTLSLAGGWLYETGLGLRPFPDPVGLKALGSGPVFLNPDDLPTGRPTTQRGFQRRVPHLRRGKILGGGVVNKDQPIRLVLMSASYNRAATIRNRINSRFPADKPVADAISPSFIEIRVPREWRGRVERFLALVTHLYLHDDGGYLEKQARSLVDIIQQPNPPYADISLLWEGLGRPVVPLLQELYPSTNKGASFFAARAGLRIGDPLAIDVVAGHAREPNGRYRELACVELGEAPENLRPEAAKALASLLADDNRRVRIAAYEALLKTGLQGAGVTSTWVKGGEFWLDVVTPPTDAFPMVYGWQAEQQRIAVFGPQLALQLPLFYVSPDETITLAGEFADKKLRAVRRVFDRSVPPLNAPVDVAGLVHFLGAPMEVIDDTKAPGPDNFAGVNLSYAQTLQVLRQLCTQGTIAAPFVMQDAVRISAAVAAVRGPRPEKDTVLPTSQPSGVMRPDLPPEPSPSKNPDAEAINLRDPKSADQAPIFQPAQTGDE